MKRLILILVCMTLAAVCWGFPKYTSRENALRLAKVIDKGSFKTHRIAAAFVKNRTAEEFYLQVILDDGSTHQWMMDKIYEWTMSDELILTDNRVLVFPSDESTEFHVLNKNDFYDLVLNSQAFVKTFDEHDLLHGNKLLLHIRRFRLIQPYDEDRYAMDRLGNRYRYVLEFQNGSREVLTYLQAWQLQQGGAFVKEPTDQDVILRRSFKVQKIQALPKRMEDELRSIQSFGVEVTFDQEVKLTPDHYPFQIVEESRRNPTNGERENLFYIRIVFPNAEKVDEVQGIRSLEYLRNIEVLTDIEHQNRIFLQAQINPSVFELPPYVEVPGDRTVRVFFFTITDQSFVHRSDFLDSDPVVAGTHHPALKPMSRDNPYEKHYLEAVELIHSVSGHHNLSKKIEIYFQAVDALHQAALNAENDTQVAQALEQRDVLYDTLPRMVVEDTQHQLRRPGSQFDRDHLLANLLRVENIAENREIIRQIASLKSALQ